MLTSSSASSSRSEAEGGPGEGAIQPGVSSQGGSTEHSAASAHSSGGAAAEVPSDRRDARPEAEQAAVASESRWLSEVAVSAASGHAGGDAVEAHSTITMESQVESKERKKGGAKKGCKALTLRRPYVGSLLVSSEDLVNSLVSCHSPAVQALSLRVCVPALPSPVESWCS